MLIPVPKGVVLKEEEKRRVWPLEERVTEDPVEIEKWKVMAVPHLPEIQDVMNY